MSSPAPTAIERQPSFANSAHNSRGEVPGQGIKEAQSKDRPSYAVSFSDKEVRDTLSNAASNAAKGRAEYGSAVRAPGKIVQFELYARLQASFQFSTTQPPAETKSSFDAEAVANNVLAFVDRRLQKDAQKGATPEQLQQRLDQAREGIEKGLAEATDILKKLDVYNDDLKQGIADAETKMDDGLNALSEKYLGEPQSDSQVKPQADPQDDLQALVPTVDRLAGAISQSFQLSPNDASKVASNAPDNASRVATESLFRGERSFELKLTTREGDVVTLNMARLQEAASSYSKTSGNGGQVERYQSSMLDASALRFSIKGDLDEDELQAVTQLFSGLTDLANEFYAGDFEKAFSNAMALEYDSSELASFSLNLKQAQYARVSQAYESVSRMGPSVSESSNALKDVLNPLSAFVDRVKSLLDELDKAPVPKEVKQSTPALLGSFIEQHPEAPAPEQDQTADYRLGYLEALMQQLNFL